MIRLVATRAAARAAVLLMTAATLMVTAAPAAAQLSVGSGQTNMFGANTRGNDAAHDPVNNVFLVVSAYGPVRGLFVNAQGGAAGSVFTVSGTSHSNYPRVAYSADLKGFLVVWTAEEGATFVVRSRTVTYPGTLGPERTISDGTTAWLEAAPALAYSSTSKQFLVAWQGVGPVKARLVGLDGAAVGAAQELSSAYGRDPGVAWNPDRNEFGVSFNGEANRSGYSVFVIVPATNLAALRRTTFNQLGGGTLANITDVAYSTKSQRFVMTWYEDGVRTKVASFDDAGTLLSHTTVSSRLGIYDSLSIAFNPTSQTFLLVGLDPVSDRLTGMELNTNGAAVGSETIVGPSPGWYARAATSSNSAAWLTSYSRSFTTSLVPVTTSATNGSPTGAVASTPAPAPSAPSGSSSSCPGGDIPGMTCVNGSYVPSSSGSSGSGSGGSTPSGGDGSCPGGVIPGMTCVNGSYVAESSSSSGSGSGGSTPSGGDGSCPGGVIPGMTCVNGNYTPTTSSSGGSSGGSSSGGDGSCPGGVIPGMTCVNGNYTPTTSGGGGSSSSSGGDNSCAGGVIPGMTCVGGEYRPSGSSSGGSSSGSTGGDGSCGGGVIPGMTCVNGSYTPTTTSTPAPSTSSLPVCSTGITVGPGPDFVRVGATEWMHSSHPSAASATCRSAG
jgi:hypothetical protein